MTPVAALLGFLIGSIPSADWLARRRGVDLRTEGSGNPGSRNALQAGGKALAGAVLVVEIAKGAGAVVVGRLLADDAGGAVAAIGAVAGNVYNPWFRLRGGKGLAITGGTLLAAWPPMFLVLLVVLVAGVVLFRRSGPAALAAFGLYVGAALVARVASLPSGWGLTDPGWLVVTAVCSVAIMTPKHLADALSTKGRLRRDGRPRSGEAG